MEIKPEPAPNQPPDFIKPVDEKLRDKPKKDKNKKAGKGVETLFRTTMSNHIRLSEMADRKANLMISINTIIISITISAYAQNFDAPTTLLIPSLLLLTVCLVTIIISLIATNPTISPIAKRTTAASDRPVDLLFFGSYTQFTPDEYRQKLRQLLTNDEDLYNSLIDNLICNDDSSQIGKRNLCRKSSK